MKKILNIKSEIANGTGGIKWPELELQQIVRIRAGTVSPEKHPDVEYELFSIPGYDSGKPETCQGRDIKSNKTVIEPCDVLFSKLNPRIPRVWIVGDSNGKPQISSTEFWPLICNERLIDRQFLRHLLLWPAFRIRFTGGTEAATKSRSRIKPFQLLEQKIHLPPFSEQRQIVKILDQADALRKKRAEADVKAARILPSLFYKMFGDPATNPKGWPIKQLGEVCLDKPQYGANAKAVSWSEGNPRYVRITDITDDGRLLTDSVMTLDLGDWERCRLVEGDVLFARSGNTVGKTYLHREENGLCAYAGYLIRFKPDTSQILPWYLFSLTQVEYYRSWVEVRKRVAGQPNINGKEYASLRIPCPPIPLQKRFLKMIEQLIQGREKQGTAVQSISYLFDVLMHGAFTGGLTAKWREAHMKELLIEMEEQAKTLNL